MNIIILIREPYLEKIPSLKTLIWHLSQQNDFLVVISSKETRYPQPSFSNSNIKYIFINKRSGKFELPTSVKLGWEFIWHYFKWRPEFCIGGDTYGNLILSFFNKLFRFKHVYFLLEYPQIITAEYITLSRQDKLEYKALRDAFLIITHDDFHKNFLVNKIKLDEGRIMLLPNSTFSEEKEQKSDFLRRELDIPSGKSIILHSGGLGVWFKSRELAESTANWPENTLLVFHTSHKVDSDKYYQELAQKNYNGKVVFSLNPVPTDELDSLVCSATIGIAIYSKEILGYRAELMGLAAGKIGNYLKCGLPVIATKTVSFSYINDYKCGVLIENESEIANAIDLINSSYDEFSNNAKKCYKELWEPTRYLENINLHFQSKMID